MAFLLWGLALVLAGLVLLVATPVCLVLNSRVGLQNHITLRAKPFGGLVPGIALFDSKKPRKPKPEQPKSSKLRKNRQKIEPRILREIPALLRKLVGKFTLIEFRVTAAIGLDDPSDTGALFGLLSPIVYGIAPSDRISLTVEPRFDGTHLDGELECAIRFTPVLLLGPFIVFGFHMLRSRTWG